MRVTKTILSSILIVAVVCPVAKASNLMGIHTPVLLMSTAIADSFWVKPSGASVGASTRRSPHKGAASKQPEVIPAGSSSGSVPVVDSIATELQSGKSVPWAIVVGLTLLTLLPALLLSMTPLVRLLVVFHFLRQALGTQTAPSNQVLMGLALMMTWFLMQPVLLQVEQQAVKPYQAGLMTGMDAMDRGMQPVKQYMLRYAREKDLAVFAAAGMTKRPTSKEKSCQSRWSCPHTSSANSKQGFRLEPSCFYRSC